MVLAALADLVLPAECAGCRAAHVPLRQGTCADCAVALAALRPRVVRPDPAPPGLPPCVATGEYAGPLRETLLAYKERGRVSLAAPLGALLAESVATAAGGTRRPVLLVPVPSTAAAVRERHGDHLRRLADRAAKTLRRAGWPTIVARPVRALPKPDATHLDSAQRAIAAAAAFRLRPTKRTRTAAAGRVVVVVDDIVTTGATLAALTTLLTRAEIPVDAAALIAATRKRHPQ
ncbi:Predicted amidophosphoribosyltransferases [Asanoa hainanensis]|uniref:Predicted amidophosphoribosyltransferases n=1 Tax=Asanoa hainanensis TaxID=560556 RepID=A0A239IGG0_9ACTN|nr:phosphoribosyltransferase [Asanoa hainanensis]SNS92512.1 Predicted amidophosphoribosyltransferases [Asanoa hainanensis]